MNLTIKTLLFFFNLLEKINTFFLRIGRQFAWIAIFLMVVVIIIQVFFRYVLNNALPWPDELARFLMLWMTGLIAPSAYRWGGFVSIDILENSLNFLIVSSGLILKSSSKPSNFFPTAIFSIYTSGECKKPL